MIDHAAEFGINQGPNRLLVAGIERLQTYKPPLQRTKAQLHLSQRLSPKENSAVMTSPRR